MFWRRMNLNKTRKFREKIHKFAMREHELDDSLKKLIPAVDKLFGDEKEMEDAKIAAKNAKTRNEHKTQLKRYNAARRSESHNEKYFFRALKRFKDKWKKLKRSA